MQDAPVEAIYSPEGNHGPEEFLTAEDLLHNHLYSAIIENGDKFIVGNGSENGFPLTVTFTTYGHLRFPHTLERPRVFHYLWRKVYELQAHELIALPTRFVPCLELDVLKSICVEIYLLLKVGTVH